MTPTQSFLLGLMVAYTPCLLLLAYALVRPTDWIADEDASSDFGD